MNTETKQILTSDGIPLEKSLKKAERRNKIKAFLLVVPLLLFLVITYISPIGELLTRSVDDKMVTNMLPKTFKAMEKWDGQELPSEEVFASFLSDYKILVKAKTQGKLGQRLNKEKNGFNSILKKLIRKMKNFEEGNYKEQIISVHKRFGDVSYWRAIKRTAPPYTVAKYLKAVDMYTDENGEIVRVEEGRRIYIKLWLRTLQVALFVTLFTFLMGYPNVQLDNPLKK